MYSYEHLSSLKLFKIINRKNPGHWVYRQYTKDSCTFRNKLIRDGLTLNKKHPQWRRFHSLTTAIF